MGGYVTPATKERQRRRTARWYARPSPIRPSRGIDLSKIPPTPEAIVQALVGNAGRRIVPHVARRRR